MKKINIKPSILPGFMELLPREQEIFNDISQKISDVYEKNGYLAIDTPIFEKVENYINNILPGVGISIGLTRLFFVLQEIGFIDNYKIESKLDYLILPIGDTFEYCGTVMKYLQSKGYGATIYFEEDSLKKKMNYANKIGVENVILIGEEEVNNNEVNIKNMRLGDNKKISYRLL